MTGVLAVVLWLAIVSAGPGAIVGWLLYRQAGADTDALIEAAAARMTRRRYR